MPSGLASVCPIHPPFPCKGASPEIKAPTSSIFPSSAFPLISQCGFFHRSSPSSSFPTNYHRAHLAMQPSAMEAGGPGTVG